MSERIQVTVEELRLLNFRAFGRARLRFSDLTFLVGRNGAGKTSILDALGLLRESVTDSLENALDRRGGLLKVRRTSAGDGVASLGMAVVFALRLPGGRETRAIYGFELLGQSGSASYQVRECLRLHPEGAGFFERRDDQFDATRWVVRHLAALTPGLTDVRTEVVLGRRVLVFTQEQQDVRRDYDVSQVSQGTLRGLGILLALRQRPTPALVLVDEVENSVHPSALGVLLDAAEASKDRVRIVFTTHSPELLDHPAATGERLRVVDWRDGASRVYRLNAETTAAVNEIETVGSMLRSNALWPEEQPEAWTGDLFTLGESAA